MAENAAEQPIKEELPAESTEEVVEETTEEVAEENGAEETPKVDPNAYNPEAFPANVGDTVIVSTKIQEDDRVRIQKYEGLIIGIKGAGISKTFTVRRIGANEIGVERIFPMYSPLIENVEVKKAGKVRRAKLNYLRERIGKRAVYVKPKK